MSTRKRPRASLQPDPEDDQQDELSPTKSDLQGINNPLGSMKKRKLNKNGPSGGGLLGIKNLVTGILGWKEKENELGGEGELDELAIDGTGEQKEKGIYDLPASGDENGTPKSVQGSMMKNKKAVGSGSKRKVSDADIWEVPNSDEDNNVAKESAGKGNGLGAKATAAQKKRTSTGRLNQKLSSPQIAAQEEAEPKAVRRKIGQGKSMSSPGPMYEPQNEEAEPAKSSERKGKQRKMESSPVMRQSPPPPQTSARKRGRPRKNLDGIIQDAKGTPKGILTPSKGRKLKSRKSVAFEHQDDNIDLGFKDLPDSATIKKSKTGQAVGDMQHEELQPSNNDACGVCSKRRQRKGNEILFCDGCEFAVHLGCYGLDSVPDGDWFCKSCKPQQSPNVRNVDGTDELEDTEEIETAEDEQAEEEETTLEFPKPQARRAIAEEEETSCAICSGLDSKIGNKIILCDSCDFAVHVKCYNLPIFPKGDWYCRTCLAGAGEDPFNLGIEVEDALDETPSDTPAIEGFEEHLRRAQKVVLDKLTGQRRMRLRGHDEEMQKVHQIVEQTVVAGEGNSMLVIGARGCGKTTLVESVISDISADHKTSFHVVRLNGFIHTDDKIASKEIWRQLGREMEVEDDAPSKPSNYADTLASLLALLSHPSENSDTNAGQTAKSVIFILDEFDLFTTHSRQTLLYNLFDIAQARKAPIVVLGLTTKIDVVESLEKRVKSRFSHRHVHLSLPRSIPGFWETCKQGLTVTIEDLQGADIEAPGSREFAELWERMLDELHSKDAVFKQHLQAHFFRSKSVPAFFTSCILPIASLSPKNFPLTGKKLSLNPVSISPPDSKLHVLQGLSELELALLISAARLDIILDTDTCNFAMVYDEYSSLTSRHKIQTSSSGVSALGSSAKVWGRDVALGCWERLVDYGLLAAAGMGAAGAGGGGAAGRMWRVDVALEEIAGSVAGLNGIMAKWCREI